MGQQYANNVHKNKNGDSQSVVEFVHGYMKLFSAEEQLAGILHSLNCGMIYPQST